MREQEHDREPLEVIKEIREVAYQRGFREGFVEGRNRGVGWINFKSWMDRRREDEIMDDKEDGLNPKELEKLDDETWGDV